MSEEQAAQIIGLLTEIRDALKPKTGLAQPTGTAALRDGPRLTDRKFMTADGSFPPAPTAAELTTYPGTIYGIRGGPQAQRQALRWEREEGVWRAVSEEARTGSQSPVPSAPLAVSEAIPSALRPQK